MAKSTIQVVLLQDVQGLGRANDVLVVSTGHARNLLFPKGLAQPATHRAIAKAKRSQQQLTKERSAENERWQQFALKLHGMTVSLSARANEQGTLFGGLGQKEIAQALHNQGLRDITEAMIRLESKITALGTVTVMCRIGGLQPVPITVLVKPL